MKISYSACFLLLLMAVIASGCGTTEGSSKPSGGNDLGAAEPDAPIAEAPPPARLEPFRVPQNTPIHVRLLHAISSKTASSGESFEAEVSQAVKLGNSIVIHRGSRVRGRVVNAKASGRLHNPGLLRLTLSEIQGINGRWIPVTTTSVAARGKSHARRNMTLIGGGSGLGAVIGAIAGGGKGAAIGAASGAAAGTAGAYATGQKDVIFAAEHRFTFRTVRDLVISKGEKGSSD